MNQFNFVCQQSPQKSANPRQSAPNLSRSLPQPRGACILKPAQRPRAEGTIMPYLPPTARTPEPCRGESATRTPKAVHRAPESTLRHATPPQTNIPPNIAKRGVLKRKSWQPSTGGVKNTGSPAKPRRRTRPTQPCHAGVPAHGICSAMPLTDRFGCAKKGRCGVFPGSGCDA